MAKGTKPPKPRKPKSCSICETEFLPWSTTQKVCSPQCSIVYGKKVEADKQAAAQSKEWKKRKADSKPLSHWIDMTQRAFNDFIRARDGEVCISCGSKSAVSYHAGHYRTTKSATHLRFNEDNCHSQCAACNVYQSGAIGPYRINLIAKIGLQRVEMLENNNTHHRYTREELEAIRARYRQKTRDLIKQIGEAA
ncbi:recombination protein NinG [Rouxiella badensis]|uniref:recombination protein NinG n=1 Tax=Rouxiella badensis TaxID=1646377 RepID=UPI001D149EF1|nr:recombination protein NinG [Rouxiella badensis]MCC3717957.1 recombination protein NinG [Rouxiella badensis]MCC3730028.1 recombination protein NinG [Rouxiella badensis]